MAQFVAIVHKDADSDFGVSFPDIDGVITAGETLDEAVAMAHEALTLHVDVYVEAGRGAPNQRPLEALVSDAEIMASAPIAFVVVTVEPTVRTAA